jgi:hypothetical protein
MIVKTGKLPYQTYAVLEESRVEILLIALVVVDIDWLEVNLCVEYRGITHEPVSTNKCGSHVAHLIGKSNHFSFSQLCALTSCHIELDDLVVVVANVSIQSVRGKQHISHDIAWFQGRGLSPDLDASMRVDESVFGVLVRSLIMALAIITNKCPRREVVQIHLIPVVVLHRVLECLELLGIQRH